MTQTTETVVPAEKTVTETAPDIDLAADATPPSLTAVTRAPDYSNAPATYLFALLCATLVTWSLGLMDLDNTEGQSIAFVSGFPGDLDQWQRKGDWAAIDIDDNAVRIERVAEGSGYAVRSFPLPDAIDLAATRLRVRGQINTLRAPDPASTDPGAVLMAWIQDEAGEVLQYRTVQDLSGDFPEYFAERVVSLPDEARQITVAFGTRESTGAFELVDANLELIETNSVYQGIKLGLLLMWIGMLALGAFWILRKGSPLLATACVLLLIVIFVGVLLPDSVTSRYILPVFRQLTEMVSQERSLYLEMFYKSGHFLFFLLTALVLMWNRRQLLTGFFEMFSILVLLAVATEGLQLHLYNRTTRLLDFGIDIAGILLACVVVLVLERMLSSRDATA